MRTIGNLLWHFPFMGFASAALALLTGLFFLITIVGAPIGLGLLQYTKFLLWPFGNEMVSRNQINNENKVWQAYSFLVTLVYFPFGFVLAILALFQALFLCISVIGIPVAMVIFKSLGTYLNPVNKVCIAKNYIN